MLAAVFLGARRAAERQHHLAAWLAWHTARLGQVDPRKFPKLEELTGAKPKRRQPQTWREQMAIAQEWTRALGGAT